MLVDISRSVARVRENNQNVEKQKKKKNSVGRYFCESFIHLKVVFYGSEISN